jgi:transposase
MLSVPPTVSIFLYTRAADLRKGFDGLAGIVRQEFDADPLDGSLFLFVNRRRDRIKILHFDGTGFWLYYKRLEAGTFEVVASEENHVEIDATQLAMLLGGVSLASAQRRKRYRRAASRARRHIARATAVAKRSRNVGRGSGLPKYFSAR